MNNIRVSVIIEGRVQGIFFRANTQSVALQNNVTGWVKNRFDSSVEAVFEGKKEDVERVILWCRVGPEGAKVDRVKITLEDYTGEFNSFSISY